MLAALLDEISGNLLLQFEKSRWEINIAVDSIQPQGQDVSTLAHEQRCGLDVTVAATPQSLPTYLGVFTGHV